MDMTMFSNGPLDITVLIAVLLVVLFGSVVFFLVFKNRSERNTHAIELLELQYRLDESRSEEHKSTQQLQQLGKEFDEPLVNTDDMFESGNNIIVYARV